jgi:hypothetical protein
MLLSAESRRHGSHGTQPRLVPRGSTHLLVVIDKFTKWIEVKPMAKIGSKQAIDFIQDIIFFVSGSLTLSLQTTTLSSLEKNS